MNSKVIWTDQVPDKDGAKSPINDISISPGTAEAMFIWKVSQFKKQQILIRGISHFQYSPLDGSRVIIGVGNRVLLYDGNSGDLIESLRGDKKSLNLPVIW